MDNKLFPWIALVLALMALAALVIFLPFQKKEPVTVPPNDSLHRYVDNETGCQYIGNRYGFSIRLDKDGKPICHSR